MTFKEEECMECGKVWTEEDEKEMKERVSKSFNVEVLK